MSLGWRQIGAGALAMAVGAAAAVAVTSRTGTPAADRGAIGLVVRDYILAHPEIIPQAMDRLQANQATQLVAANRRAIETPYPGARAGDPHGDVTLVEYLDYACGYCRASVADVDRLIASDPRLRVVFRELPILSPISETAAKASLAAARQGRFYAFHKALYAGGRLSEATIAAAAATAGVTRPDTAPPDAGVEIAANIAMARTLRIAGTPSFIVGDRVLAGAVGYDALASAIADARAVRKS